MFLVAVAVLDNAGLGSLNEVAEVKDVNLKVVEGCFGDASSRLKASTLFFFAENEGKGCRGKQLRPLISTFHVSALFSLPLIHLLF